LIAYVLITGCREAKGLQHGLKEFLVAKNRDPWDREVEFQRKKFVASLFAIFFQTEFIGVSTVSASRSNFFSFSSHILTPRNPRMQKHTYGCKPLMPSSPSTSSVFLYWNVPSVTLGHKSSKGDNPAMVLSNTASSYSASSSF